MRMPRPRWNSHPQLSELYLINRRAALLLGTKMENIEMNTFVEKINRQLLVVVVAVTLALSVPVAQVALSALAGMQLTSTAYACQTPGGGC